MYFQNSHQAIDISSVKDKQLFLQILMDNVEDFSMKEIRNLLQVATLLIEDLQ